MARKVKVMVVGLDGAPFDVILSLTKQGALPNFRRLMEDGSFGVLRSTIPPVSPIAWPSLITGENSGKHGMFDFKRLAQNHSFTYHTSASIRGKAIWDILSKAGKRVVLLNVPWTFPPYKINGIMVSGFPSPGNRVDSYPTGFIHDLNLRIKNYQADISYIKSDYEGLDEERFLNEIHITTKNRAEAMNYLIENCDWDFFMVVFTNLDRIQHVLFGFFDEKSPLYNEEKRDILINYYKELDDILGKSISLIDEKTILMIVSDHGFEPLYKYVGVNNLLAQGGFVKLRKIQMFTKENIINLLKRIGIANRVVSGKIAVKVRNILPSKIDLSSSRAYSIYQSSLLINRKSLRNESCEKIKERLIHFLCSVIDKDTRGKIIEKVYTKEEIYSGSHMDEAPDLIVVFKEGYEPKDWAKDVIEPVRHTQSTFKSGAHKGFSAQRGIFITSGKGIKKNFLTEANIVDVAPTILHLLGFSVPLSMDGRVLEEVFEPYSDFAKKPIKYQDTLEKDRRKMYKLSEAEKEDIQKRLRALGYIG